jgi:hypothetical protein
MSGVQVLELMTPDGGGPPQCQVMAMAWLLAGPGISTAPIAGTDGAAAKRPPTERSE